MKEGKEKVEKAKETKIVVKPTKVILPVATKKKIKKAKVVKVAIHAKKEKTAIPVKKISEHEQLTILKKRVRELETQIRRDNRLFERIAENVKNRPELE